MGCLGPRAIARTDVSIIAATVALRYLLIVGSSEAAGIQGTAVCALVYTRYVLCMMHLQ